MESQVVVQKDRGDFYGPGQAAVHLFDSMQTHDPGQRRQLHDGRGHPRRRRQGQRDELLTIAGRREQ